MWLLASKMRWDFAAATMALNMAVLPKVAAEMG
jgi:hypothetical protein